MEHSSSVPALEGLAVEAVEWLPSGADSGLVRVRGRWTELGRREPELPALVVRRGEEARRFESLPDARFGRDPAVWRATYLVPAALMDPGPDELWLSWESGARAGLPAPARGFEPPATPDVPAPPEPEGEVIDRAVLAERRARRAEGAEQAQARRAAEALKAVEVLELRSAELERRLEALQGEGRSGAVEPPALDELGAGDSAAIEAPGDHIDGSAGAVDPTTRSAIDAPAERVDTTTPPAIDAPADQLGPAESVDRSAPATPSVADTTSASPAESGTPAASLVADPTSASPAASGAPAAVEAGSPATAGLPLALPDGRPAPAGTDAAAAALTSALAAVKRLRSELGEQRRRLRKSELLRAADGVALASLRGEQGQARRLQAVLADRERDLAVALAAAEAHAAEAVAAREQAAEQVASAVQRAAADAAAVRNRAAEELAAERAATADARAELEATRRDLATERRGHAATRDQLATSERELAEIGEELADVRADLASARDHAKQGAAALEAERDAHRIAATERETARAQLALAESARSAESVARAALDEELDRERVARAALIASLEAAKAELRAAHTTRSDLVLSGEQARTELAAAHERAASAEAAARAELAAANERAAAAEAERAELGAANERAASAEAAARSELDAARGRLAATEARIADLERELEAERGALHVAGREAGGLVARIAQLERAGDHDLDRRAQEQAEAASAVEQPAEDARRELTETFDAAAAALRARAADETKPGPGVENAAAAPPAEPALPAGTPPPAAVAARPARPRIVTEAKHPARADVVGSSKRRYPWLRGALVKLAHDDPRAATRLVLGLVPVQRALVARPLEYDLTIRGSGTYAIGIGENGAQAQSIGGPRPRDQAEFHVSADIVTLTELLAGVEKRMGRWIGSVKVHGRRRRAQELRAALVRAELDLPTAARAGADLDPDLVFRAFAYAIHPSWTIGHAFTVTQEIAGPRPMRWHLSVRDGKPVTVARRAPKQPADAVVVMTRDAFTHLLRGERPPSGERPVIRGDRVAVTALKGWTDRAQGR